jgi:hypothetical protein
MKVLTVKEYLLQLFDLRLLDDVSGTFQVHNWNSRQFKSDISTDRVRAFRERNGNVSVTRSEQSRAETEQRQSREDPETPPFSPSVREVKNAFGPQNLNGHTSSRFLEWAAPYPLKDDLDMAARMWVSRVTVEDEAAAFACRDRYLLSGRVADGFVDSMAKFIEKQARNGWNGEWPGPKKGKHQAQADEWDDVHLGGGK